MSANLLKSRCTILAVQNFKNFPKCCYSSYTIKTGAISEIEVEDIPKYEVETTYGDVDLDKLRNISRLNPQHRNILHGQKPYNESHEYYHDTVWYRKRMLGRYGMEAAGVTAAICWPTKEDIENVKAYESIAYPTPLKETMKEIEQRKIEEAEEIRKREEEIDKVVVNFDKWRAVLDAKVAKKEAEILEAKRKKEKLLAEIREQVGYNVDPRDERFKAILEQKEKEDKKRKKEEKKKAKAEKMLAYIQRTNVGNTEKQDEVKSEEKEVPQKNENAVNEKDDKKTE